MAEIAEILLIDEETVRTSRDGFDVSDMSSFLSDDHAGYHGKLTVEQTENVRIFVRNTVVMDSAQVVDYIKKLWDIHYSPSGIVALLRRLNFTYKKTKHMPSKADAEKQQAHIEKYETLVKNLKDDEILYFIDGVHPLHNSINACGWIEKGEDKYIKANTGRDRVNIN